MNLRHAIQSVLGVSIMALSSSAYVYGQQQKALTVADNLCEIHSIEQAIETKFYSGELNTREGIQELQNILVKSNTSLGEDPFPLFHIFSDGLFTREMHAPKGHLIIGKIHTTEHIVHLIKGSIIVADEFGTKKIIAPAMFTSKPGVKRVGYTYEDTVWMDIYRTEKSTVKEAMDELYCNTYDEYEGLHKIINSGSAT